MGIATFVKILGLNILAWNFEIFVVWDFSSTYAWCNIWGWRPCMGIMRATQKSWVSKSKVLAHCANKNPFAVLRLECHFCWTLACHMYGTIVWYILPFQSVFFFSKKTWKLFLYSILWGRWVGHYPKEGFSLAKIGYRLERKVEKFTYVGDARTLSTYGPFKNKFPHSVATVRGPLFPKKIILYSLQELFICH